MTLVLPGEFVGASEEYSPKAGTYSDSDDIFASRTGSLKLDSVEHSASVLSAGRVPRMQKEGVITFGMVADVSESVAIIDLLPSRLKKFDFVPTGVTAVLHVSKVRQEFTKCLRDQVRIGDIVRVKIDESDPQTVRVTTMGRELGVVKAFCSRCRHELLLEGVRLKCSGCGNFETRKYASDYGEPKL